MKIFELGEKLLEGVFYTEIIRKPSFKYYHSVFKENFYNLILPTGSLDWENINQITNDEAKIGRGVSLYIPESETDSYASELITHGYLQGLDDLYIFSEIKKAENLSNFNFVPVIKSNFDKFVEASAECFPEFPNNTEYCQFCFDLPDKDRDKINYNMLLIEGEQIAAFGSVLVSQELKLAFLHNMGTLPQFRRKGYFVALTNYLTKLSANHGAKIVYANVEDGGASHQGFTKLGYQKDSKFYHFVKSVK